MSERFLRFFSEDGKRIVESAVREAQNLNHFFIGVEHVFLGMLTLEGGLTVSVLEKLGVDKRDAEKRIKEYIGMEARLESDKLMLTPRMTKITELALTEAKKRGVELIGEIDLLLAMISEGESVPIRILRYMNVNLDQMKTLAISITAEQRGVKGDPNTPLLNMYGRDLTQLATEGKIEPVIGRESEMSMMARILMKKKKNNPLIVGEAGVGKTAVVEGLAYKITSGEAPSRLRDKRVIELLMPSLVAGTMYRGQFEERLTGILNEIKSKDNLIVFIDEIHTILHAGAAEGGAMDAANIMKPMLARGELRCIGATTYKEYLQYIKKDSALERRFELIRVLEPTPSQTMEILSRIRATYEKYHGVTITDDAIKAAVELSVRYMTDRNLPDKAIDLIDEACSRETFGPQAQSSRGLLQEKLPTTLKVDREDIAVIVSERTGVPVRELVKEEKDRFVRMEEIIKQRIIGQDHCVKEVCERIQLGKAGLTPKNRPIGIFLFLGPTGVGKTELAKALAEFLFHDENMMITLDMSEYKERASIYNLIGSPRGHIAYEEGGRLTNMVRQKPFSIILLDEIEKAHPDVHDLFLQVFDEGRLTDQEDRPCDFTNTIIIMTSNLGMDLKRQGQMGFTGTEASSKAWRGALEEFFRPEFLNRIDKILVFNPLSKDDLKRIFQLLLSNVKKALAEKNVVLDVTDGVIDRLIGSCDPNYGARPLRRAIEEYISEPLSKKLLAEEIQEGDAVLVSEEKGQLEFTVKRKRVMN